ncbi:unnamed protein product [Symbiodinium natans]|uniref:Uncharacterized protein n=1 Tax=Symbiodinium natans TaxID=878477 RepID=A0A812QVY1_9DINO|nr:unnamed protein product [Symbiodinium natans]
MLRRCCSLCGQFATREPGQQESRSDMLSADQVLRRQVATREPGQQESRSDMLSADQVLRRQVATREPGQQESRSDMLSADQVLRRQVATRERGQHESRSDMLSADQVLRRQVATHEPDQHRSRSDMLSADQVATHEPGQQDGESMDEQVERKAAAKMLLACRARWHDVSFGDVIIFRQENPLHYGHFGLVLEPPEMNPAGFFEAITGLKYMESSSNEDCPTWNYVFVDMVELKQIGQLDDNDRFSATTPSTVEIWQAPQWLRENFSEQLANKVIDDMMDSMGPWSWATLCCAIASPCPCCNEASPRSALASSSTEPICTSLPVKFWQMYMERHLQQVPDCPLTRALPCRLLPAHTRDVFEGSGFRKLVTVIDSETP